MTAEEKIAALMADLEWSERTLCEGAAIARPTFRRRMRDGDWKIRELERIAHTLGVTGNEVMPDSLRGMLP